MNKQLTAIAAIMFSGLAFFSACEKPTQTTSSLDGSSKEYIFFREGSTWQYANLYDSMATQNYSLTNFIHSDAEKDHNEVLSFDMVASNQPTITLRAEAGGEAYKDRLAMLTKNNDTIDVGPVVFNINNTFTSNSGDTITQLATYHNGFRMFKDVVRIGIRQNRLYRTIYFAKGAGLIRRELRDGKVFALRNYSVVQ